MKTLLGKIAGYLLLAGIFFGLFVVLVIPFEIAKKARAETWPARKGVVTTSYASLHRGSAGKPGSAPYWKAEVCGTYAGSGEKFCVTRIRYGGFRFGDGKAEVFDTVARYPAGSEVEIYHAPDDPKETVLEAHSSWTEMLVLLGLGVSFLLLPLLLWLFRKRIEPERYG